MNISNNHHLLLGQNKPFIHCVIVVKIFWLYTLFSPAASSFSVLSIYRHIYLGELWVYFSQTGLVIVGTEERRAKGGFGKCDFYFCQVWMIVKRVNLRVGHSKCWF